MFGNQNRSLRQRATTTTASTKPTTGTGGVTSKRAVLGEIKLGKNTISTTTAPTGKGAAGVSAKTAKQSTTIHEKVQVPVTRSRKSLSSTAAPVVAKSAPTQKPTLKAAPVKALPVAATKKSIDVAPTDRKTRSSRNSSSSSSSSDDAGVKKTKATKDTDAEKAAPLKRKSRTSQAAAAALVHPPTAAIEVEEAQVSKPTTAKAKQARAVIPSRTNVTEATKKAFEDPSRVTVAAVSRRTSRKNSREEGVEEVAKIRVAKKARTIPHDDLDKDDFEDPMMVTEYVEEIFEYLRELEVESLPNPNYMENQKELQWKMRGILVDWLIEVHTKFRLLPETLFLAVNIIDRFLSLRVVSLVKLQLVGVTALFIASKYEEVMSPSIQSFLYMAEDGYTESEIIRAERYMLQVLKFNMQYPTPLSFLRRSSKADDYDIQTRTLAKYLMEITLLDHAFLPFPASCIAASAHYLARHMLDRGDWNSNLEYYSGYSAEKLSTPVALLLKFLAKPHKFTAIHKKYSQRKFMKGAVFVDDWIGTRKAVGMHPVYLHPMNVEARADWIRAKNEKLEEDTAICDACSCAACACYEEESEEEEEENDSSDEESDC